MKPVILKSNNTSSEMWINHKKILFIIDKKDESSFQITLDNDKKLFFSKDGRSLEDFVKEIFVTKEIENGLYQVQDLKQGECYREVKSGDLYMLKGYVLYMKYEGTWNPARVIDGMLFEKIVEDFVDDRP